MLATLSPEEKIEAFLMIGQKHNEGLAYAFDYLDANALNNMNKAQLKELVKTGIENYLTEQLSSSDMMYMFPYSDSVFNYMIINSNLEQRAQEKNLSNECTNLFRTLDSVCESGWDIAVIESLEFQAINILGNEEELFYLTASSVAKATNSYWAQNYSAWNEIIDIDPLATPINVAKADVAGAVGGVMRYWWLGGAGWAASAIGWGCISSAVAILK